MATVKQFEFVEGIEYVKIHGLQRTGTNYLAQLINENLENTQAMMNAGGWKHGHYCAPWTLGREVHVVTITKNPYAWLVSLYNYWKHNPVGPNLDLVTFPQFVWGRAIFEESAGTPFLLRAENPVQHWNDMNFHWLTIRMNEKQSLVIPYEALLFNAEGVTEGIGQNLGLKRKAEPFCDCLKVCEPGDETPKLSEEDWSNKNYYVDEGYLDLYSNDLLKFVNKELDPEVMSMLGYRYVKEE
jgi:hypothetical protein